MFKQTLFSTLLLLSLSAVHAQSYEDEKYDWEKDRKQYSVSAAEQDHPAIILKRYSKVEYAYDAKGNSPLVFKTLHIIMRVNTADAINDYNKIYIPMDGVEELLKVKARTISKGGKVTELNKDDIHDIKDDEEGGNYKSFALEGLEPGSEIEYLYITKEPYSISDREYFQSDIPWKNCHFELVSPDNLVFKWKGYNGLPDALDTTIDKKNYIKVDIASIPEIEKEEYSLYNSNRMRLDYYLAYNKAKGNSRVYTLSSVSQVMFETITKTESAEKKSIDELLKNTVKITTATKPEDKIRKLENYLKTSVAVYDNTPATDIPTVLKNKYASELGIMRVYAAAFKAMNVNFQIVITSDRSKVKFDPDLDGWTSLDHYVFYFPESDKYLAPQKGELRYGIIPVNWAYNYGLFIKPMKLGETETGLGKVNFIPALTYDKNYDDLDISIAFTADERQEIKAVRKIGGCNAIGLQPVYPLLTKDKQKELSENLIKSLVPDAEFVSMDVKNADQNSNPLEDPFTIAATVKSSALLERAGSKLLFKIGEVIGPQVEMYQDKERKFDVENDYNRKYDRVIKFTIPENYSVKNLDDLKIDVHHLINGEKVFAFESNYTVSGNTVTVNITEYYKNIVCPKSDFQEFRNVINASADFNKVVLVMEKK